MIIDTTVQEKAVAFPTDARLMHRARERLVRLARHHGVALRQSYARVGKRALIKHQRYAHARHVAEGIAALNGRGHAPSKSGADDLTDQDTTDCSLAAITETLQETDA